MSIKVSKRYEAINRKSLLIVVMLPDSKGTKTIEFLNGYGLRNSAYIQTSDELIQKCLDNDHRLNKTYRVAEIDGIPIEEYEARKAMKEQSDELVEEEPTPTEETTEESGNNDTPISNEEGKQETETGEGNEEGTATKSFKNAQAAKDWLNDKYEVPFNQINNKTKIIAKAKELGFDLVFESDNK